MLELTEKNKKVLENNCEILEKLESWISTQPHIPKSIPRTVLFRYYKICHYDLEVTKKLIDINVKSRIKHQYFLANRDINSEELRRVIKKIQYTSFPKLTKEGYSIESYRFISSDLNDFFFKDIFKYVVMFTDVHSLIEPDVNGLVSIYDANGFTFSHFMKFVKNFQRLAHFSHYGQDASCVELRNIHFVNCSQMLTRAVSFLKPLINDEVAEKLHFHTSGFETLHNFIDRENLPIDYGGYEGTLEEYAEMTLNKVEKYSEFLKKDENFFLINQ